MQPISEKSVEKKVYSNVIEKNFNLQKSEVSLNLLGSELHERSSVMWLRLERLEK